MSNKPEKKERPEPCKHRWGWSVALGYYVCANGCGAKHIPDSRPNETDPYLMR
jgi:hypothetical protein